MIVLWPFLMFIFLNIYFNKKVCRLLFQSIADNALSWCLVTLWYENGLALTVHAVQIMRLKLEFLEILMNYTLCPSWSCNGVFIYEFFLKNKKQASSALNRQISYWRNSFCSSFVNLSQLLGVVSWKRVVGLQHYQQNL